MERLVELTARIPLPVRAAIQRAAEGERRSFGAIVREVLCVWAEQRKGDAKLAAASAKGMKALKTAWSKIPTEHKENLKPRLERRHKRSALAADNQSEKTA